jgi:nucleotidyltransferase/DNA polymerase involved in DNA repair
MQVGSPWSSRAKVTLLPKPMSFITALHNLCSRTEHKQQVCRLWQSNKVFCVDFGNLFVTQHPWRRSKAENAGSFRDAVEKMTKETKNSGIGLFQMVGVSPNKICAKVAMSIFPPESIRPTRVPA